MLLGTHMVISSVSASVSNAGNGNKAVAEYQLVS